MDDVRGAAVLEWLTKAEHDLASAKRLGFEGAPILDTAIYHCQQAAEKALKAVLLCKGVRLRKTHDLRVLLDDVASELPYLESLRTGLETLTPYAMLYRYPGAGVEPKFEEFRAAIAAAEKTLEMVKGAIRQLGHQ